MTFLLLSGLFCLLRLIPLFTAIERIFHYDEFNIGFVAVEWLKHPNISPWNFQFDAYGGESLLLGAMAVPFVKGLGATLLAIKIPSLLFAIGTFALLFHFIHQFFGREKAILASLLLIFCPPAYVQFSLSGMTGHTEALFFAVGMAYFFYQFFYSSPRSLSLFLAGVSGGIGFWIYHETLIIVLACLLVWMIAERKSLNVKFFFVFAAGVAIGLLPAFGYALSHGSHETSFLKTVLSPFSLPDLYSRVLIKKMAKLLLMGIPFSFAFFPVFGIHERILSTLYFALAYLPLLPFMLGKLGKILQTGKDPEKICLFLIFPFVFLAVFFLSPFDVSYTIGFAGFRYLSPLHLFLLPLPALLLPSGKMKKCLIGTILFAGLAGQTSLFFQEPFGLAQTYKGNSYYQMGTTLRFCLAPRINTLEDLQKDFEKRDDASNSFLLWGITDAALSSTDGVLLAGSSITADQTLAAFGGPFFYEWKGSLLQDPEKLKTPAGALSESQKSLLHKGFFEYWDGFSIATMRECPNCFENLGPGFSWAWVTFGRLLYYNLLSDRGLSFYHSFWGDTKKEEIAEQRLQIQALHPTPEKEILIERGIALAHFRTAWDSNLLIDRSFQTLLDTASPQQRQALFWGLGWVARAMFREDRPRALRQLEQIPQNGTREALKGFQAFEKMYSLPQITGRN